MVQYFVLTKKKNLDTIWYSVTQYEKWIVNILDAELNWHVKIRINISVG